MRKYIFLMIWKSFCWKFLAFLLKICLFLGPNSWGDDCGTCTNYTSIFRILFCWNMLWVLVVDYFQVGHSWSLTGKFWQSFFLHHVLLQVILKFFQKWLLTTFSNVLKIPKMMFLPPNPSSKLSKTIKREKK